MLTLLISVAAFLGVAALVGGVATILRSGSDREIEDRLDVLTGHAQPKDTKAEVSLVSSLEDDESALAKFMERFVNLQLLLDQSGVALSAANFALLSAGTAVGAAIIAFLVGLPIALVPFCGLAGGILPFMFILFKRRRRLSHFGKQLPEALELISRALRAGHSLAAGISLVADELGSPVGDEFGRCYEEQNLGIPLEEALEDMATRVPNLDLRFFVTAVILQRQTGGDLAEILDKIGHLIRERFKIWGQIQALTGEGRLSGIVLLALPPALFIALWRLNPDYCMILFEDPMGQQMLIVAVVMQIVGALVIRKIVNIKV